MRFDQFSIKTRLIVTFALILGVLVLIVGLAWMGGARAVSSLRQVVEQDFRKYEIATEIDTLTKFNARNTLELFVRGPVDAPPIRARMGETRKQLDELFQELESLLNTSEGKVLFAEVRQKRVAFVSAFTKAADMRESDPVQAQLALVHEVLPAIDELAAPVNQLKALQIRLAKDQAAELEAAIARQNFLNAVLGLVALAVGVTSVVLLMRSIMPPLRQAMEVLGEIAQGNLTVDIRAEGNNEITRLMESMHHMKERLAHVLMRIQDSSVQVASASGEIAAANQDLSARTESQASSLQETAASMEQITGSVQKNADITQTANQMAGDASRVAREVGALVGDVVHTMQDIHSSSQRINDIIGVIDSIAFQTNILALNAAVEAARAGEQGRGFAVVASEVRSLAQRSAAAAQEIKGIIQANVEKMSRGNELALKAGDSVQNVVEAIDRVSHTVAEVTASSREQTAGIEQIGQAVSQLDQATQQNAALVEETSAATTNLNEQVQALKTQIGRFNIGHGTSPDLLRLQS